MEEGFAEPLWGDLFSYETSPGPDTEPGARAKFSAETTCWRYENWAEDPSLVSPDNWLHDQTLLNRPGNDQVQPALFRDYPTNIQGYPQLHEHFRASQVPLLTVRGERDEIFGPDGARPSRRICPMLKSICSQPVILPWKRTWTP